jgi:hypothetical protein
MTAQGGKPAALGCADQSCVGGTPYMKATPECYARDNTCKALLSVVQDK